MIAITLYNLKNYEEALNCINCSIQNNPEEFKIFLIKSKILRATHKYKDALMSLEDAIKINPLSDDAYNQKCFVLVLMGRLEEALENIETAIKNSPESSVLFNNKGCILHFLGRSVEASLNLDHAIKLSPQISIFQKHKQYLESQQCTSNNYQQILEHLQLLIDINEPIQNIYPIDNYYLEMQDQFNFALDFQIFNLDCK
ncbi:unnamed protein product [Paramecium sonneborni]|uniref:Tetratricopeptide repeat protein n=1 Tax=Paramecium sonneborni TaxID=65129 RepID=A0A8S1REM3_9CILI|nr:unnamed protein product [Paramecium sonneborni]